MFLDDKLSVVDAQLPPALARMLAAKGFEAEHYDVELGEAMEYPYFASLHTGTELV